MAAPQIDKRDVEKVFKEIREMVPFYTPEWKASDENDSGVTLLRVSAQMIAGVIDRLNQVPDKNFIAFLNMLGLKLLPATEASAPVTFNLSTGVSEAILIPERTEVAASSTGSGEPIIYRTTKNIMATPAKLIAAFNVDKDCIYQAPQGVIEGRKLTSFNGSLLGVENEGKTISLKETTGLEEGDILKINEEYTEILRVSDSTIELRDELKENHDVGDSVKKVTIFELFTGINRQEHILYLGHEDLFNVKDPVRIQLDITGPKQFIHNLAHQKICIWQYWNEGWINLLVKVDCSNSTDNCIRLVLEKQEVREIKESEVNGQKSRWIRCLVMPQKIANADKIQINTIKISVMPLNAGVQADLAFNNDIPLYLQEFYPYGKRPRQFDTFYLACQEAFSKKGSIITITLKLSADRGKREKPSSENTAELSWEYWNGMGWIKLPLIIDKNGERLVTHFQESLQNDVITLDFKCPDDIVQVAVNGQLNYWIRSRMISGSFGREVIKQIDENTFELKPEFCPPKIRELKINYSLKEYFFPNNCIIVNNLENKNRTNEIRSGKGIKPFYSINQDNQAIYFGFDRPPSKGPISIFFSLEEQEYLKENKPTMEWEYFRERNGSGEWVKLEALDGTNNLTQGGILEFTGPMNFYQSWLFGKKLYWIRALNSNEKFTPFEKSLRDFVNESQREKKIQEVHLDSSTKRAPHRLEPFHPLFSVLQKDREKPPTPKIKGIFMNTTMVTQAESVREEIIGSSDGKGFQSFVLSIFPVIDEEIYVNELDYLSEKERKNLVEFQKLTTQEVTDERGEMIEFWVKWIPVEDLMQSNSTDRHYEIDRTSGRIQFGDGIHGAVPPLGTDNIKADFRIGGGEKGNVGAQEINTLLSSIAFVDSVTNPEAAEGGCDAESLEHAVIRGPQMLKHRNRAVTLQDFEILASQASRRIAKVKCLPNTNESGQFRTGCVTVLIVPHSHDNQPKPTSLLKRQVENYLNERSSNLVVPNHILVTSPAYVQVSISVNLFAESLEVIPLVENSARKKLTEFLHPLTGGHDGGGWEFGRIPCLSNIYTLLQGIKGVDHMEEIIMTITTADDSQKIEVTPDNQVDIKLPQYALISAGKHYLKVNGLNNK